MNILIKLTCLIGLIIAPMLGQKIAEQKPAKLHINKQVIEKQIQLNMDNGKIVIK